MHAEFLDYVLPPDLIAQEPCARRDQARLLQVSRQDHQITHHVFSQLPQLLNSGDLLVLNDTCVVPARLVGHRARTGGRWEGLFLRVTADGSWELLSQTRGRLVPGETIEIDPGPLTLVLAGKSSAGRWLARPEPPGAVLDLLGRHGRVPLPPYIRKGQAGAADPERYQTVFARRAGAVAAPTAGLHFTGEVLERLEQAGISRTFITLHVGPGTFQPIQVEDVTQHHMHAEWGELPETAADAIGTCRQRGGRIVAVGTTSVRALETVAASGPIRPWSGETGLYIYPPYSFRAVDALITNFHLPRTSLLLLVSAFAGVELIREAYRIAIVERYRFYSYGDAMLIV
jgi:S-adenosylmethionine:tRNA ribosyltransferase-isomerase